MYEKVITHKPERIDTTLALVRLPPVAILEERTKHDLDGRHRHACSRGPNQVNDNPSEGESRSSETRQESSQTNVRRRRKEASGTKSSSSAFSSFTSSISRRPGFA